MNNIDPSAINGIPVLGRVHITAPDAADTATRALSGRSWKNTNPPASMKWSVVAFGNDHRCPNVATFAGVIPDSTVLADVPALSPR